MDRFVEKRCDLCGAVIDGVPEASSGEFTCRRCHTTMRCDGKDLLAINIPRYYESLEEIDCRIRELTNEIEMEGLLGEARDMRFVQELHDRRQAELTEYRHLSYFERYVEAW